MSNTATHTVMTNENASSIDRTTDTIPDSPAAKRPIFTEEQIEQMLGLFLGAIVSSRMLMMDEFLQGSATTQELTERIDEFTHYQICWVEEQLRHRFNLPQEKVQELLVKQTKATQYSVLKEIAEMGLRDLLRSKKPGEMENPLDSLYEKDLRETIELLNSKAPKQELKTDRSS